MDPDQPAKRLFGNGPPFDEDRPEHWDEPLVQTSETVRSDPRSVDPPKRWVASGAVELEAIQNKVTYDGTPYLDTPDANPSGTVDLPATPAQDNLFFADLNAYDLGMVNRTTENDSVDDLQGYTDKGIIESHRWTPPDDSGSAKHRSVRNVVDRHRNGVSHRLLWQNMKLVWSEGGVTKKRRHRGKAWGRWFGRAGFDIVGMCELYNDKILGSVKRGFDNRYSDTARAYGKDRLQDLGVLVGKQAPDENGVKRRLVEAKSGIFDNAGPGFSSINKEGWQMAVIEVPGLPGDPKFELFLTHLQGVAKGAGADTNEDKKQQAKLDQLEEVKDVISARISTHGDRPKILMGDFNIHSKKRGPQFDGTYPKPGTYFSNFMSHMDDIGMEEAWLTHGGPAPSYESDVCTLQRDGYTCDPFEPPPSMTVDEYYRQDRLDYVFVERPRDEHGMRLDLSRMKMASFRHGSLSDHNGITFELVTSPAG
jgi:hypothetical protein